MIKHVEIKITTEDGLVFGSIWTDVKYRSKASSKNSFKQVSSNVVDWFLEMIDDHIKDPINVEKARSKKERNEIASMPFPY